MQSFKANQEFINKANLSSNHYQELQEQFQRSKQDFWANLAKKNLTWNKDFSKVFEEKSHSPYEFSWFEDGTTSISYNCLDQNVKKNPNKTAIIFERENGTVERISYQGLLDQVQDFASALQSLGLKENDHVIIYMPISIKAIVAMHACQRIGAVHSVVFAGFSAHALKDRIEDLNAKYIICTDAFYRKGQLVRLIDTIEEAVSESSIVSKIICNFEYDLQFQKSSGELISWSSIIKTGSKIDCKWLSAEHPSFILYTSGSTGKPKGILHTSAGYLLWAKLTCNWVFDLKDEDIFWCTADIGWITGHSYVAYGPLAAGKTIFIYDGAPNYPDESRFWQLIAKHKVTVFYTAPTAIRSFMLWGDKHLEGHDLSSLRLLGSVGEPINPAAWLWYYEQVGKNNCPIVDTWWQTETGGIMITTLPGIHTMKPGSAGLPLPGVEAEISELKLLTIKSALPSMARSIWGDKERYHHTYWANGFYLAGDAASKDEDNYISIEGRIDDVINVSGHRLGTAEIESALVAHPDISEAAVVSIAHELKGEAIIAFVISALEMNSKNEEIFKQQVVKEIGALARPERVYIVKALPKTRSGKIMRRLLKDLANKQKPKGDLSTLENPAVIDEISHLILTD